MTSIGFTLIVVAVLYIFYQEICLDLFPWKYRKYSYHTAVEKGLLSVGLFFIAIGIIIKLWEWMP